MTVVLINRARRMKVLTLAHETYCATLGSCACTVTGARTKQRIPRSLTLASGTRSTALPEAVLRVPDVMRAIAAGEIGVERVPVRPPAPSRRPERSRRSKAR